MTMAALQNQIEALKNIYVLTVQSEQRLFSYLENLRSMMESHSASVLLSDARVVFSEVQKIDFLKLKRKERIEKVNGFTARLHGVFSTLATPSEEASKLSHDLVLQNNLLESLLVESKNLKEPFLEIYKKIVLKHAPTEEFPPLLKFSDELEKILLGYKSLITIGLDDIAADAKRLEVYVLEIRNMTKPLENSHAFLVKLASEKELWTSLYDRTQSPGREWSELLNKTKSVGDFLMADLSLPVDQNMLNILEKLPTSRENLSGRDWFNLTVTQNCTRLALEPHHVRPVSRPFNFTSEHKKVLDQPGLEKVLEEIFADPIVRKGLEKGILAPFVQACFACYPDNEYCKNGHTQYAEDWVLAVEFGLQVSDGSAFFFVARGNLFSEENRKSKPDFYPQLFNYTPEAFNTYSPGNRIYILGHSAPWQRLRFDVLVLREKIALFLEERILKLRRKEIFVDFMPMKDVSGSQTWLLKARNALLDFSALWTVLVPQDLENIQALQNKAFEVWENLFLQAQALRASGSLEDWQKLEALLAEEPQNWQTFWEKLGLEEPSDTTQGLVEYFSSKLHESSLELRLVKNQNALVKLQQKLVRQQKVLSDFQAWRKKTQASIKKIEELQEKAFYDQKALNNRSNLEGVLPDWPKFPPPGKALVCPNELLSLCEKPEIALPRVASELEKIKEDLGFFTLETAMPQRFSLEEKDLFRHPVALALQAGRLDVLALLLSKGITWPLNNPRVAEYNEALLKGTGAAYQIHARTLIGFYQRPESHVWEALKNLAPRFEQASFEHALVLRGVHPLEIGEILLSEFFEDVFNEYSCLQEQMTQKELDAMKASLHSLRSLAQDYQPFRERLGHHNTKNRKDLFQRWYERGVLTDTLARMILDRADDPGLACRKLSRHVKENIDAERTLHQHLLLGVDPDQFKGLVHQSRISSFRRGYAGRSGWRPGVFAPPSCPKPTSLVLWQAPTKNGTDGFKFDSLVADDKARIHPRTGQKIFILRAYREGREVGRLESYGTQTPCRSLDGQRTNFVTYGVLSEIEPGPIEKICSESELPPTLGEEVKYSLGRGVVAGATSGSAEVVRGFLRERNWQGWKQEGLVQTYYYGTTFFARWGERCQNGEEVTSALYSASGDTVHQMLFNVGLHAAGRALRWVSQKTEATHRQLSQGLGWIARHVGVFRLPYQAYQAGTEGFVPLVAGTLAAVATDQAVASFAPRP